MPDQAISIIAWKRLSRRSELLAKVLNAKLWFFKDRLPYAKAATKTLLKIIKEKPGTIIVQLPQGPLLLEALIIGKLVESRVVADVHTGFMMRTDWKGLLLNVPFLKLLPATDLIIVHNDAQLNLIPKKLWKKTMVVLDPWYLAANSEESVEKNRPEKYVVFPASFAPDEPLEEVIRSINTTKVDAKLYVTGNWKRQPKISESASNRIIFTGYIPDEDYEDLLRNASAIIAGTKREYTSLMAAWEAVAYAKPLALTRTKTLEKIFKDYAFFYDWTNSKSIAEAIEKGLKSEPRNDVREKLKTRTTATVYALKERLRGNRFS